MASGCRVTRGMPLTLSRAAGWHTHPQLRRYHPTEPRITHSRRSQAGVPFQPIFRHQPVTALRSRTHLSPVRSACTTRSVGHKKWACTGAEPWAGGYVYCNNWSGTRHTQTHTHTHINTHACARAHTHTHKYAHTQICTHSHSFFLSLSHTHTHTYNTHAHIHTLLLPDSDMGALNHQLLCHFPSSYCL